jgi:DNA polymerase III delta prime subunit
MVQNSSWFMKYAPDNISNLIFDNEEHKKLVEQWYQNECIDGNVLFFGSYGLGKTVTAEILIRQIIKVPNDLLMAKERSVKEIREKIMPFVRKSPVKSKKKIIYIEEMDKMHPDAFNLMKTGLMEKYQNNCSFIACTNYIKKIEGAVLTRFNYKIPFTGNNVLEIYKRMKFILDTEGAIYDDNDLKKFIKRNFKAGIRELINLLQNSYISNNKQINFKNINETGSIEENIVKLIINILGVVMKSDAKNKKLCLDYPENSIINEDYKQLVVMLHNNIDIDYDYIYNRLYELSNFIPIKTLCAKYADQMEFKKFPHINLLGFYYELIKTVSEINRI